MPAYYNEIDPYAAQWLRNLIAAGHIADGVVDERSIEDVLPRDLDGFEQCHFFAGIGVWSHALRRAGWADDRPVWTGSCPCQPFSSAGKGARFDDERHLWPAWHHLIKECRPSVVFGEQVASKDAEPWLDLVQDDLEAMGYAFGAVPFPAASVGAPHIRDRLYWLADANRRASDKGCPDIRGRTYRGNAGARAGPCCSGMLGELAHTDTDRRSAASITGLQHAEHHAEPRGGAIKLGDTERDRLRVGGRTAADLPHESGDGPLRGFWAGAECIYCRDEKWRPVEPGTFPLAHGAPARVGRLRAYGNAICAEAAVAFIEAASQDRPCRLIRSAQDE
ncbi:DNA cytosine methyltransferase [Methylibium sp.]|uniref:DNA cytosine methyltransferase n=1 Tax=Methylibium sp. TaxID=2067992 RepID=UPI003BAD63C9